MSKHLMLIAMLVTTGCAEFVPPAPHDHHFHEPETTFNPKDHYTTVADVIRGRGCSTGPLKSLDTQIAAELSCLAQTPLGRIDQESTLRLGEGVRPHLQRDAADAIKRAGQRLGTLMLTSGWRSVAQQHVLKSWEGSCGIGIAATPGRSFHQSALAIDTGDFRNRNVRRVLREEGFTWYCDVRNNGRLGGCADPVHFVYDSGDDLRDLSVLAFQRLWNRNHPEDQLTEDGLWGPDTARRIERSPVAGFDRVASCENAVEHDNHTSNQNVCEDNAHEVSFGYEVCETEDVWRCACNGDLGETISQVCRDGVWLNHHLSPVDCSQCNAETSEGCRSGTTRNPDDVIAASETCGDSTLEMSETGEQCDAIDDGAWRCACSANIGDVVSQVCRDGQWTNYRVSPQDCGACNGEYSEGCEP